MNRSLAMQTPSDGNKGTAASPNSTDHHHTGTATELGRHYGEHGHPATTGTGPAAQDTHAGAQARSGASGAADAARDIADRARVQAGSVMAQAGETAQDLANRAREQAGPAAQAVYDQGARAGQYVARNVHEYPATALLIAAAVGYGLAYLLHGGSRRPVDNSDAQRLRARRTN
jgi:ElaB/YqjD/DUF883 family membrane-anchored ribosome-binding protein